MKSVRIVLPLAVVTLTVAAWGQSTPPPPAARVVDLKASDGMVLKATYFAAAKQGPGVLLFHQSNRTRKAWDDVAGQLAAAGINTLAIDIRGYGESGGEQATKKRSGDID